ncbi:hypothetical protein TruAng_008925 [Truncatella angustata]|nr:hypothetical protein TruAng_008925 [Truncatella angustata]
MAAPRSILDEVTLQNDSKIPHLGFGVYKSPPEVHIDTAQYYANESQVGEALERSGLARKEIFVTSKILEAAGSVDKSYQQCVESIEKLDAVEHYADLYLIHSPNSGTEKRKEMWLALEKLYQDGKAKSIGVSNFSIEHIEELKQYAKIWPPHVNQIELHPWCQQRANVEYCVKHSIAVEAYCPLVRNKKADEPTLKKLAEKHGVSNSQILIRWSLQRGFIPLPKSDTPSRINSNADIFGFDLSDDDMTSLNNLNQGREGSIVQPVDN